MANHLGGETQRASRPSDPLWPASGTAVTSSDLRSLPA